MPGALATVLTAEDRIAVCCARVCGGVSGAVLLLFLLALLAGCASYEPAPLHPEESAAQFGARHLQDPELRDRITAVLRQSPSEWPLPAWNRAQLLAVAMVWNPRLAVVRAQVEAALAHEVSAAQTPNP